MAYKIKQLYDKGTEEFFDIQSLYKHEVFYWLNNKTQGFILDYLAIKNSGFVIKNLTDYSYLTTPIFKALEGTMIQIGENLGFDIAKYNFKIGVVFSEENLEKFYSDVLDKIEDLNEDHKSEIQMWLNDARRLLRHFRHSPAHYSGELKSNWDEAFSFGDHIFRIINEMCFSLLESKIFDKVKK